jgi:DinB family protein
MLATINRETALKQLDSEHAVVRGLIDTLTDEEMTRPDTIEYGLYWDQHLSFKDLLAHLVTYEAFSIEALEAWQKGQKHAVIDEMQSESGSRQIHYNGIENRRKLSLAEMLDQWERTQAELMEKLHGLTSEGWHQKAPFSYPAPLDLGGILEIILVAPPRPPYRHLPVHIPDVPAYIRSLRS